ncbi:nucleotide exchange factor GrpE [Dictyobacter kobayashii]|uniref:Protein GrpE n=1 Tax=Dictyobacter kobayashii TaxID=2014872 RepID=A0A402AY46_9CHLR|nr:nucleotide exchange factor GrpE [Dictyobacter kobayashii]GCE24009.1 protein GrpE [Dictyobacter kobayashii]
MSQNDAQKPQAEDVQADTITQQEETATTSVEQQLAQEQQKCAEYLDLLKRSQADFINYKRRARQEQAEARASAQAALFEKILPVLDDLGRAMSSMPPELANNAWARGVDLAARQLINTLEQLGVKAIGEPGETFDPYKHDAILRMASKEHPEGTIIQVVRPGYMLGDRVIRPAQVVVSTSSSDEEDVEKS